MRVGLGVIGVAVGHGVRLGVRVQVGKGVRVAVRVGVGPRVAVAVAVPVAVRVAVAVFVAVAVGVAVGVTVGVGGSPVTVKDPLTLQSWPIKMRTSYGPGSHSLAEGCQSEYPYPPDPPSQGFVSANTRVSPRYHRAVHCTPSVILS